MTARTDRREPLLRFAGFLSALICLTISAEARDTEDPNLSPETLTVVTWNVENLFDTVDDPKNTGDDEYLPGEFRQWTADRYAKKLKHLVDVLAPLVPDIIGLCEVENRQVLNDLRDELQERTGQTWPHIIHREGPDYRGIDVALLSRHPPQSNRWLTPVPGLRDILITRFSPGGSEVTVCMNHWKSRRGKVFETLETRHHQARALRTELDVLLKKNPDVALLVMGDFNDDVDDASLVLELKTTPDRHFVRTRQEERFLYNLHGELERSRDGTYYNSYGKTWHTFDSISVSVGMLSGRRGVPWAVIDGSYRIVSDTPIASRGGRPYWFRKIKNSRTDTWEYHEGYSDHFPVMVQLQRIQR